MYNQLDSINGVVETGRFGEDQSVSESLDRVKDKQMSNYHKSKLSSVGQGVGTGVVAIADEVIDGDEDEKDEDDAFDDTSKGFLQSQKQNKSVKATRFAVGNSTDGTSNSTKEGSNPSNRSDGNSRAPRYTISQRMNDKFSAVLKLFPSETGMTTGSSSGSLEEEGGHDNDVAAQRENVLLMLHEKEELEKEDVGERVILHLTCRVSGDLLNICISWQPHLERLKFVAHCLQLYVL